MYLIYNLIALVFAIAFFILLFLFSWYIAIPLLILAFFVWVLQQFTRGFKQNKPSFILKRKKTRPQQPAEKVIDVEWTEV